MALAAILVVILASWLLSRKDEAWSYAVITFHRHTCFGTCPDYSVTIRGDGTVVYQGNSDVKVLGLQSYKISSEKGVGA